MKHLLAPVFVLLAAAAAPAQSGACCSGGTVYPWQGYNEVVRWEPSLAHAQAKAQDEKKLIVFFRMVGDLDLEGC